VESSGFARLALFAFVLLGFILFLSAALGVCDLCFLCAPEADVPVLLRGKPAAVLFCCDPATLELLGGVVFGGEVGVLGDGVALGYCAPAAAESNIAAIMVDADLIIRISYCLK
jgi:hypothetical protein